MVKRKTESNIKFSSINSSLSNFTQIIKFSHLKFVNILKCYEPKVNIDIQIPRQQDTRENVRNEFSCIISISAIIKEKIKIKYWHTIISFHKFVCDIHTSSRRKKRLAKQRSAEENRIFTQTNVYCTPK